MISVVAPTGKYILQPSLVSMHQESMEWISTSVFWKKELVFFKTLLSDFAPRIKDLEDKKKLGHFESVIAYYQGEIVDGLVKKVREHETRLASMLKELNEAETGYFREHGKIMDELKSFQKSFHEMKHELYVFLEKFM